MEFPDTVDLNYSDIAVSPTLGKVYVGGGKGIYLTDLVNDVDENVATPSTLVLMQNYPNPFNGSTVVPFWLSEGTNVEIQLFELTGRAVRSGFSGFLPAGKHHIQVDASGLSTGVYFYRLRTWDGTRFRRMLILR
jgi:hypothetical protein